MSYIGNPPAERFTSFDYQDLTGGTGTSFTLTHPVGNAQEILVMVNNVVQEPGVAYTVSGTALTMTGSIVAADDFYVVYRGKAIQTATHPSDRALTATDGTFTGDASVTGDLTVDTDTLHVDAANNRVGVGTTSPAIALETSGSLAVSDTTTATKRLQMDGGASSHTINSANYGSDMMDLNIQAENLVIKTGLIGVAERARFPSSGGITFNGDTAAANALDDYEEGTWTATLKGVTTDPSTAVTSSSKYTKIGKLVHIECVFNNVTTTGASGAVQVSGIPFSADTANRAHGTATCFQFDFPSGGTSLTCEISGSNIFFGLAVDSGNWVDLQHSAGTGRYLHFAITYHT